jgi:hypothetical protein
MMVEALVVGVIVAAAAAYSVWTLMPAGWRNAAAQALAQRLGRDEEQAQRLKAALAASAGCSECSSCKGCSTPATSGGVSTIALPASRRVR